MLCSKIRICSKGSARVFALSYYWSENMASQKHFLDLLVFIGSLSDNLVELFERFQASLLTDNVARLSDILINGGVVHLTLKIYENDEVSKEHFLRTKSLIGEEAKIIWIQAGTTCGAFSQQIRPRIIFS